MQNEEVVLAVPESTDTQAGTLGADLMAAHHLYSCSTLSCTRSDDLSEQWQERNLISTAAQSTVQSWLI